MANTSMLLLRNILLYTITISTFIMLVLLVYLLVQMITK